jgi:aspartokinase
MKGLMLLNVDVPEMEDLSAAAAATFRVLHEHRVEVVLASQGSSRRRMTYLVDTITGGCGRTQELIEEALGDVEATVSCAEDVAVVAAVGHGAAEQASELGRMLSVLERAGVPILAASQQMSNMALVAAVPGRNAERAVDVIHTAFIRPQPGSARGRRPRRAELLAESLRVG